LSTITFREYVSKLTKYLLEDVLKVFNVETDLSPNLSPTRGEALKTPFPCREGGKGG
jgi:DNA polymerase III psi subunit